MCNAVAPSGVRLVARFAFAAATAALLAGCADTTRFTGDPLGNPFKMASTDRAPTGSLEPRANADDMAPPPYQSHSAVTSHPLAAPAPSRVASYEAPRSYAPPKPEFAAPSGHGSWTSQGGMSVTAADGDTAAILAARYNVPTDALIHANGFRAAADIRPGTRLVIPIYQAGGARVAESVPHGRERLAKEHLSKTADRKVEKVRREEVTERDEPRKARHDDEVMHWKKGPAPARMGEADPRTKAEDKRAARKLEREEKAEREPSKAERKAARQQAKAEEKVETRRTKVATAEVEAQPVREVPASAPHKAQADTTPTASLPPAAEEKVASSGGPEFRWPAHGRIIQGFKAAGNDGINIAVPDGTPVKAAESGVVAYAGSEIKGFGNLVLIRHPNGFVTAYANNGSLDVKRGEQVKRGQTIAMSGQSGNVSSPQLHFEVRKGSTPVDPTRYLAGL
ncbi:Peptidase M23B [Beijerinckiaceae bacterium RH AL1]|nr:peptidoglycan DD-metalloendopeptidase family protein [Beijerinckiaceae bacterium]VVB43398.1 Peptidase M23B [Beijerinckiaceae bacterium RH AL8]VVB43413.1 Peptidase M23B [Beijerinckiaceae bacterium RH CH11]VVC53821.1 Peptidase M23B [Beijerinckiaceae bacterium RH AL1]